MGRHLEQGLSMGFCSVTSVFYLYVINMLDLFISPSGAGPPAWLLGHSERPPCTSTLGTRIDTPTPMDPVPSLGMHWVCFSLSTSRVHPALSWPRGEG